MGAAAYGDTLFGQQVGQIAVMDAIDRKACQRQLRIAEQSQACPLGQTGAQRAMQGELVPVNSIGIQSRQVVQRGAQADHTPNGRGSGFETQWGRVEVGMLEISDTDHFPAELPMLEFEQRLAPAVERANTFRAVQLVAGDRKSTRLNSSHMSESRMPSSA